MVGVNRTPKVPEWFSIGTSEIVAASASGANVLVAAVAGKSIRLKRGIFSASAAVNMKFQSNTTDLTGLFYVGANGALSWADEVTIETNAGEALNLNLSAAVPVGGILWYELVE